MGASIPARRCGRCDAILGIRVKLPAKRAIVEPLLSEEPAVAPRPAACPPMREARRLNLAKHRPIDGLVGQFWPAVAPPIKRWHRSIESATIRLAHSSTHAAARGCGVRFVEEYNHHRLRSATGYVAPRCSHSGLIPSFDHVSGKANVIEAQPPSGRVVGYLPAATEEPSASPSAGTSWAVDKSPAWPAPSTLLGTSVGSGVARQMALL